MVRVPLVIVSDAGTSNILKKSSTEEILSHSVSETNQLQRQKELEKLQKKEQSGSGQDLSANSSKALDKLFKVKFNIFLSSGKYKTAFP